MARFSPLHQRMGLRAFGIAIAATTLASAGLGAQQVRDSAGIRIVENPKPVLAPNLMWRVLSQPILEIGRTDGDSLYEFLRVMGVARLSDGRIAVGNQGTSTIRFYDARGSYRGFAGREGDGPGEFRQILGLTALRGDTLAVTDLHRVNYFTGTGQFARSISMGSSRAYPLGFLSNGSYLGLRGIRSQRMAPRGGSWIDTVTLLHMGLSGTADSIGRFPLASFSYSQTARGGTPVVFGVRLRLAASGNRLYIGFPTRFEIGVYSPEGRLEAIIRRAITSRPVPSAAIAEYRERYKNQPGEDGRPPSPQLAELFGRHAAEAVFAEELPVYSELRADRAGHLWVRQYETWEDGLDRPGPISVPTYPHPSIWDVFTPQGAWLGRVELPAGFAPLEIGADYVAGVWRNADDVEFVRLYRLVR